MAAPTTNNIEESSEDEEEDSKEAESAEENAEKEDNVEETGGEEVESAEENVAVMEEEGGEDDGKTDGKEATDEVATNEADKTDVAGGGEHPTVDTQDTDCEPFQADNGPSDDDTTLVQEKDEDMPATAGKKKPINKPNNPAPVRKSARISRVRTLMRCIIRESWGRTVLIDYVLLY